jgi:hypothetical protein
MKPSRHQEDNPVMDAATISQHLKPVENANRRLQTSIRTRANVEELLDRVWCLQDELRRLLQVVDESPWIATQLPGLSSAIINEIRSMDFLKISRLAAVQNACESINQSLILLEKKKEEFKYGAVRN